MNGSVNPNGMISSYHFEFGTTTAYGSATADATAGLGTTDAPVSETLTGLPSGTTIHYRLVATNAGGTATGADRTFTTTAAGGGGGGGGGGGTDRTAPKFIGSIAFTAARFAAASSGPSAQAAKKRKKPPVGTTVSFRLDETASVRSAVERALPGHRSGTTCVRPTRRNRKARKCTRYALQKGTFTVAAKPGVTRFKFSGRLGGKKLAPGAYRLVAVATDAARNASAPKRAGFTIVRR